VWSRANTAWDQRRVLCDTRREYCILGVNNLWDQERILKREYYVRSSVIIYEIWREYCMRSGCNTAEMILGESVMWDQAWILYINGEFSMRSGTNTEWDQAWMLCETKRDNFMRYEENTVWNQTRILYDIRREYCTI
jgi:hypothetical protein